MSGRFITVEGIEGVGKSTQIDALATLLRERGFEVLCTREPGGTPTAERIRDMLLEHGDEPMPDIAESLLFFAARALHIDNAIKPALARGLWVVCDRFTDASRAYQGYGRELGLERIDLMADWVHGDLQPDVTILLDAPVETGMLRARQRGGEDRLDSEAAEFFRRVRAGYLALAAAEPSRFTVIDATQDVAGVQADIASAMHGVIDEMLLEEK